MPNDKTTFEMLLGTRVTVPVFGSVPIFGRVAKNVKFCTNVVKNFTKHNFVVKV